MLISFLVTAAGKAAWIRLGVTILVAGIETFLRGRTAARFRHMVINVGIFLLWVATSLVGFSLIHRVFLDSDWLNHGLLLPLRSYPLFYIALSWVILDLSVYWSHRVEHSKLVWSVHRVHHNDAHVDASTYFRKHPGNALFTVCWTTMVIVSFGIPAVALITYLIIADLMGLFIHMDARLPLGVEKIFQRVGIVTPTIHRIHHSIDPRDANSNFGQVTSWWDRLFGLSLIHI